MAESRNTSQNQVGEWSYRSARRYEHPHEDVSLDVIFTSDDKKWRVPAFWAGDNEWRVRFAPPAPGRYTFLTECCESSDDGLHGRAGELMAAPYSGNNALLKHGAVRVSLDRRYFEHEDATPFFWLGDTWWMGFTQRLSWPDDFQHLAADRIKKGFSVIQIVAGLYPDMEWYDPRGANEAGYPYSQDFSQLNPAYFEQADLRIQYLIRVGLVPCIVGCWAYFLKWMGVEKLKAHWRYLVARWGAYPVVWCLAGEGKMPYYLSTTKDQDALDQQSGWTEIGRYMRQLDPMRRPITIHPCDKGRDQVSDDSILDFDMLQTGHGGYESVPNTIKLITSERTRTPVMPVVNGEVNYEGFMHGNYDEVQRMVFWSGMLSGLAGHTYGANGIWQVNTRSQPYGASPHGNTWGNRPWNEAMSLPGSAQLGLGKKLLERYRWWEFEPHQEWVQPAANHESFWMPYAAGIPRVVRIIYTYHIVWGRSVRVKAIENDVRYRAFFWNPESGTEHDLGVVTSEPDGSWLVPQQPELRDWVLVLVSSALEPSSKGGQHA